MANTQSFIVEVRYQPLKSFRRFRLSAGNTMQNLAVLIKRAFSVPGARRVSFFMDNVARSLADPIRSPDDEFRGDRTTDMTTLSDAGLCLGKEFKCRLWRDRGWTFSCEVIEVLAEPTPIPIEIARAGRSPVRRSADPKLDDFFPEPYSSAHFEALLGEAGLTVKDGAKIAAMIGGLAELYEIIKAEEVIQILLGLDRTLSEAQIRTVMDVFPHTSLLPLFIVVDFSCEVSGFPSGAYVVWAKYFDETAGWLRNLLAEQAFRTWLPRYVPASLEKIACRSQWNFVDQTPQYKRMRDYVMNHRTPEPFNEWRRRDLVEWLVGGARNDDLKLTEVASAIGEFGWRFETEADFNRFAGLYMDLSNHSRKAILLGHTPEETMAFAPPHEITGLSIGPGLREMLSKEPNGLAEFESGVREMFAKEGAAKLPHFYVSDRPAPPPPPFKKVGRNDPCPCGSGKKYKNCCGR